MGSAPQEKGLRRRSAGATISARRWMWMLLIHSSAARGVSWPARAFGISPGDCAHPLGKQVTGSAQCKPQAYNPTAAHGVEGSKKHFPFSSQHEYHFFPGVSGKMKSSSGPQPVFSPFSTCSSTHSSGCKSGTPQERMGMLCLAPSVVYQQGHLCGTPASAPRTPCAGFPADFQMSSSTPSIPSQSNHCPAT